MDTVTNSLDFPFSSPKMGPLGENHLAAVQNTISFHIIKLAKML